MRNKKAADILKSIAKWYLIIIFFPISLFYLYWRDQKKKEEIYKGSTYYQSTGASLKEVRRDRGRRGEYLLYECLHHLEKDGGRFLFNLYIPKNNGDTTEIDVVLISRHGVFVFESKNYSGWIFGSGNQKEWTQTLAHKRGVEKTRFYNPIWQNNAHIESLRTYMGWDRTFRVWSVIAFSDHCELKSISNKSKDVYVVNRCDVPKIMSVICANEPCVLNDEEIERMYDKLFLLSQVDEEVKNKHNEMVKQYRH